MSPIASIESVVICCVGEVCEGGGVWGWCEEEEVCEGGVEKEVW